MNCRQVVLSICLLLSTLAIADAIKCYQCQSHTQPGCYPLNTTLVPLHDCPPEALSCEFITMKSQFKLMMGEEREPMVRYLRGCSNDDLRKQVTVIERAGTGANTKTTYHKCNVDGCNPAGRIAIMTGSGFIAAFVLMINYFS
ncbi:unnamed protein product [Rodentolepis nana]|uniref:Protein quiver n=1 Tax=Rodentolepis nana TaxID=102285 RepID=A0A0R3TDN5_RODNA|nr:unnamed protein product [Rodentolepis nana]